MKEREFLFSLKSAKGESQELHLSYQRAREKSELLEKQLEVFTLYGLSPEENAFQQALKEIKLVFKKSQLQSPKVFVSYACDPSLQKWITRLSKDLQTVGSKVFFDLDDMHGNVKDSLKQHIDQSNYFISVCTPRWKERLETGLTDSIRQCIQSNDIAALESGLLSAYTSNQPDHEFMPLNNLSFEFIHFWTKVKKDPSSNHLIFLHYDGHRRDIILPMIQNEIFHMARELRELEYHQILVRLSAPLGIVPIIFGVKKEGQEGTLKSYKLIMEAFDSKMKTINLEKEKLFSQNNYNVK
jgi:hypothetical protein